VRSSLHFLSVTKPGRLKPAVRGRPALHFVERTTPGRLKRLSKYSDFDQDVPVAPAGVPSARVARVGVEATWPASS
jgi:hypothetical protein